MRCCHSSLTISFTSDLPGSWVCGNVTNQEISPDELIWYPMKACLPKTRCSVSGVGGRFKLRVNPPVLIRPVYSGVGAPGLMSWRGREGIPSQPIRQEHCAGGAPRQGGPPPYLAGTPI